MNDYLPHGDSELASWTARFVAKVLPDPGSFGLAAAQVAELDAAQRAFAAALKTATQPVTRTVVAVEQKNMARKALVTLARSAAGVVQKYPGTTNPTRVALGLTIPKKRVRAVAVTIQPPSLWVLATRGAGVTLRVGKREGKGRARPAGAKGYTWFYAVGETYPASLGGWSFGGNGIEAEFEVALPGIVPGAKVWFTANWFNSRVQPGPLCAPIETRVAGGFLTASNPRSVRVTPIPGSVRLAA